MFGVDALQVQEIVRYHKMTPTPHAPDYVLGLINLRGQILTTIDLRYRLTGKTMEANSECMNVIIKSSSGATSILVEDVGDVIEVGPEQLELPPETMSPSLKYYIESVCKLEGRLLNILDTEKIVSADEKKD